MSKFLRQCVYFSAIGVSTLLLVGQGCVSNNTPDDGIPTPTPTTSPTTPPTSTNNTPSGNQAIRSDPSKSIVDNMAEADPLFTFIAALSSAELVDQLKINGPYTIFAPTNEAFDGLSSSTIQSMLGDSNRENLRRLLNFHIVRGRYVVADLSNNQKLKTLNGEEVQISKQGSQVMINNLPLQVPDLTSSNGVIHVIPRVLIPKNFRVTQKQSRGAPSSSFFPFLSLR